MSLKKVLPLTALAAAVTVVLTGCGAQDDGPARTAGSASAVEGVGQGQATSEHVANVALVSGTPKANNAPADSGDTATGADGTPNTVPKAVARKWVALKAGRAGALKPVVVNGAGLTLYRFDKDVPKPSKSNCAGDCAVTLPPVTVAEGSKIFFTGVKKADIGVVKRDDGTLQVTIGGWPIYRFNKDKKPGDTLGQGVGGTWFGVTPDGKKAGGGTADQPPTGGEKATSALLFDDPNLSDSGPSQSVSGAGCQNLDRPDVTSSISVTGSVKLWADKDCQGKSIVITGDVKDLATISFDNDVASVFFG